MNHDYGRKGMYPGSRLGLAISQQHRIPPSSSPERKHSETEVSKVLSLYQLVNL